ncbi:MAG: methyltransferase domain-containing protein [Solirubrobacteraceae bacterium]
MQNRVPPRYVLTAERGHAFVELVRHIAQEPTVRSVCDIGGGANPVLSLDDIERLGVRYLVVDASAEQLAKTPTGYDTRAAEVGNGAFALEGEQFDLVVSQFVAEHVADPASFHADVRAALRPSGRAAHLFPTLPGLPFVANRLLRGRDSRRLLDILWPEVRAQEGLLGKFPPLYRWCEGPTHRQYRRFASAGFVVEDYLVHVGHIYYQRFPSIQRVSDAVSRQLIRRPWPGLSTYATVVLRRVP